MPRRPLSAGFTSAERTQGVVDALIIGVPFAVCALLCALDGIVGVTDDMRFTHGSDATAPRVFSLVVAMICFPIAAVTFHGEHGAPAWLATITRS